MWQLVGFYLGVIGGPGRGRALGADEVKFGGEVTPAARLGSYHIHMKRVIQRKLFMGIADATVAVDGNPIYTASGLRVGLFTNSFESTS
jgi:3-hydroxyacyl-[acyl-carrier protein] dehydratase/trans-2-decenoyl-[acyl-carrier protein] isomerase